VPLFFLLFAEQSADNVLEVNVNEQDVEELSAFIDLRNIFIQVEGCHEGTRLFPKDMLFETKINCLILSTNPVLDG